MICQQVIYMWTNCHIRDINACSSQITNNASLSDAVMVFGNVGISDGAQVRAIGANSSNVLVMYANGSTASLSWTSLYRDSWSDTVSSTSSIV